MFDNIDTIDDIDVGLQKSNNDWEGTFFTCKYKHYVRHGSWRGYRCMKDPVPYLRIPCYFHTPNKKCPDWEAKD